MIIRELKRQDLDEINECAKQSFADQFEVEGYDPEVWTKLMNRRFSIPGKLLFALLRLLDSEPVKFYVADINGKAAGTAMVEKHGRIGYIESVMVHPDYRQKGIATELMNHAISYLRQRKLDRAVLHVLAHNQPAKRIYQKLGFKDFEANQCLRAEIDSLPPFGTADSVELRDFAKSDIDPVYDLVKISRDPEKLRVYDFKKTDLRTSLWQLVGRIGSTERTVAVKDGKIVGYASTKFTTPKIAGRITNIEVRPDFASQGIEEQLIRNGAYYLKSRGARIVLATIPLESAVIERLTGIGFEKAYAMEGMVLEPLPVAPSGIR